MNTLLHVIELDECGSTNEEAWKLAVPGVPTLVFAHHQTRGRGRQGRKWESGGGAKGGNLMASLAMPAPAKNITWLPLAAGVAAVDAVGSSKLRLKWPNDIYAGDAKAGGILCESRWNGETSTGVVVGFGLNIVHAPKIPGMKTASLKRNVFAGRKLNVDELRWQILRRWSAEVLRWSEELSRDNTALLRREWKKRAQLKRFPEIVTHDVNGKLLRLKALDLDDTGRLKAAGQNKILYLDSVS